MSSSQLWGTRLINCLVEDIPKRFGKISRTMKPPHNTNVALILMEAVLSINQSFDSFVVPTLKRFSKDHPDISSLQNLLDLIYACGGPAKFFRTELMYYFPERAKTLFNVLKYLISIEGKYQGANEFERLHNWAVTVSPRDYVNVCDAKGEKVYGFGIATFQYIRMLLGADTIKTDRYVKRYIQDTCGTPVSEAKAVQYLEETATRLGISARELDHAIWNLYEQDSKSKPCQSILIHG